MALRRSSRGPASASPASNFRPVMVTRTRGTDSGPASSLIGVNYLATETPEPLITENGVNLITENSQALPHTNPLLDVQGQPILGVGGETIQAI